MMFQYSPSSIIPLNSPLGGSMREGMVLKLAAITLAGTLIGPIQRSLAQSKLTESDKPASNLEIVHEKLKADKKLIVAKYMQLTESEATKFWPVYDEYQKDLQRSNERLSNLLKNYAADHKQVADG
jgi:hypothetical protein